MVLVILAVSVLCVRAAEDTAAELYGRGVHAYFAGDYDSAMAFLNESIAKNATDPRPYYYRGLALAATEGLSAALPELAHAAEVEVSQQGDRRYDVNAALQRVQGAIRMELEKQRRAVRMAAAERKKKQDQIKYEELKRREEVVLYRPDQPAPKLDFEVPEIDLGGPDPFATGAAFTGGQEVAVATPRPIPSGADSSVQPGADQEARDPFAETEDDMGSAADAENPFGTPAPSAKKPPAQKPAPTPPAAEANPFGDDMEAVTPDNPLFDDSVRPNLPPGMNVGGTLLDILGKTLSGQGAGSADRDPFGGAAPAAPPAEQPAPADSGANPFDDAPPAKAEPAAEPAATETAPAAEPAAPPAEPDDDPFR
jgi:hypothetical protein